MIEELKLIVELLQGATDTALYAFVAMGVYNLLKTCLWVFPVISTIKFIVKILIIPENKEDKDEIKKV